MACTDKGILCSILFVAIIALTITLTPATAHAQLSGETQRVIVKLHDGVEPLPQGELAAYQNMDDVKLLRLPTLDMVVLEFPIDWDADLLIETLKKDPAVEYLARDQVLHAYAVRPNDLHPRQWALGSLTERGVDIKAPRAWAYTTGSTEVVVAVLDSGIDYTHPDLIDNMWINEAELHGEMGVDDDGNGFVDDIHGYNFTSYDGYPWDDYTGSHGTAVAGAIAAQGNNGLGTVGTNWDVSLMAVKVINFEGFPNLIASAQAVDYVIRMKRRGVNIRVINMSYGPIISGDAATRQSQLDIVESFVGEGMRRLQEEGILVVLAAGNGGGSNGEGNVDAALDELPNFMILTRSVQDNIIAVANSGRNGALAFGSNYGATSVDLGAPGDLVYLPMSRINGTPQTHAASLLSDDAETENVPRSRLGWSSTPASSSFQIGNADALPTTGNVWTNEALIATTRRTFPAPPPGFPPSSPEVSGESVLQYHTLDLSAFPPTQNNLYLDFKAAYDTTAGAAQLGAGVLFRGVVWVEIRGGDGPWSVLTSLEGAVPYWRRFPLPIPKYLQGSTSMGLRFRLVGIADGSKAKIGDTLVPAHSIFLDDIAIRRAEDNAVPSADVFYGTSVAAPFVTGAVALLASHRPDLNYLQIRHAILDNVQRRGGWESQVASGGVLDVAAALASVTTPALVVTPERPAFFNRQPTTLTVALTREPGALPATPDESNQVVVRVTARSAFQVDLQPSTLTFTADNWHVPQPVTLTATREGAARDPTADDVTVHLRVVADDSDSAYHDLATEIAAHAFAVSRVRLTPSIVKLGETVTARVELNLAAAMPVALSMTITVNNPMTSTEVTTQITTGARSATLTFTPDLLDLEGITEQVRAEVTLTATLIDTGESLNVPPVPALRITPDALLLLRLRTFLEGALQ